MPPRPNPWIVPLLIVRLNTVRRHEDRREATDRTRPPAVSVALAESRHASAKVRERRPVVPPGPRERVPEVDVPRLERLVREEPERGEDPRVRHGHDDVELMIAQPFMIERSTKPARYKMTQVDLAVVFEFVDDVPNDTAATVRGDRRVEVNRAMGTVRTAKRRADGAFEGL